MKGYIDFVIRTTEKDAGELILALAKHAPHAHPLKWNVAIEDEVKALPAPKQVVVKHKPPIKKLSKQQKVIYAAVLQGHKTAEAIKEITGMVLIGGVKRAIRNLQRKGYIVQHHGEYYPPEA